MNKAKPLRGYIRSSSILDRAEVTEAAQALLPREGEPPELELKGTFHADTFDTSDVDQLKRYTTLINKAFSKDLEIQFITRRWVPEEQKIVIYCEWAAYTLDAKKG